MRLQKSVDTSIFWNVEKKRRKDITWVNFSRDYRAQKEGGRARMQWRLGQKDAMPTKTVWWDIPTYVTQCQSGLDKCIQAQMADLDIWRFWWFCRFWPKRYHANQNCFVRYPYIRYPMPEWLRQMHKGTNGWFGHWAILAIFAKELQFQPKLFGEISLNTLQDF